MNSSINPKLIALVLLPLVLTCLTLLPRAQAVVPAPDGGYPGFNTAEGDNALFSRTTGNWNTAIGAQALFNDTIGTANTAIGYNALFSNVDGNGNTGNGTFTLFSNTGGDGNTALGNSALFSNTNGNSNTAMGANALHNSVTGSNNIAVGQGALANNLASDLVAVGFQALNHNTTAGGTQLASVAVGFQALNNANAGDESSAFGTQALFNLTTGIQNHAVGWHALFNITSGSGNTALGEAAGANYTGADSNNVCIGRNIVGVAGESNRTRIRNINTTTVSGTGADFVTVFISGANNGIIGHLSSSQRYKEDVKPMDNASEVLYQLKPVTFHYTKEIDPAQGLDYGLVAEDVAKIDPKLAIRDGDGKIESVRYFAIYNMMLNEFIKEHKKVQDLEATVSQQEKGMELLAAQLKEQAAQIQKVSAQVETSKPTQKVVANQ